MHVTELELDAIKCPIIKEGFLKFYKILELRNMSITMFPPRSCKIYTTKELMENHPLEAKCYQEGWRIINKYRYNPLTDDSSVLYLL